MTVTSFLLALILFIGGCVLGAALYQWNLLRKIKSTIKSFIDGTKESLDFHEIHLQNGKKIIVSKSLVNEGQYVIVYENSDATRYGIVYFDENTHEITSHGTVIE